VGVAEDLTVRECMEMLCCGDPLKLRCSIWSAQSVKNDGGLLRKMLRVSRPLLPQLSDRPKPATFFLLAFGLAGAKEHPCSPDAPVLPFRGIQSQDLLPTLTCQGESLPVFTFKVIQEMGRTVQIRVSSHQAAPPATSS